MSLVLLIPHILNRCLVMFVKILSLANGVLRLTPHLTKLQSVDFDILKSMEFGNLVDLLSSSRRFDRVYQG